MSKEKFFIAGYSGCGYFALAKADGKKLMKAYPDVNVEIKESPRSDYMAWLQNSMEGTGVNHRTSPAIWKGEPGSGRFIGGASEFNAVLKTDYPKVAEMSEGSCCIIS